MIRDCDIGNTLPAAATALFRGNRALLIDDRALLRWLSATATVFIERTRSQGVLDII